ncbi:hypothetical protein Tco_0321954 [Tanacetum coccineum]
MVVTWCGASEVVLAGGGVAVMVTSGGEMIVWRSVGCGDGGDVVEAAMVMAAAKAMVVRRDGGKTRWRMVVDVGGGGRSLALGWPEK